MVVVADTSPLNYLVLIDETELLPRLYGEVIVPAAVREELLRPGAPPAVRHWMTIGAPWLSVATQSLPAMPGLDQGEAAAISLIETLGPDSLLLIDDWRGRRAATMRGIRTNGTIGVLRDAAALGFVDLADAIARLRRTNFRVSQEMVDRILKRP